MIRPAFAHRPRIYLLLAAGAALLLAGCGNDKPIVGPRVYKVPEAYPDPQAAVDAAQPGEVVVVQPGVYTHTEVRPVDPARHPGGLRAALFMKDGVSVVGLGSPGTAVLRDTTGADSTVGVVFDSLSSDASIQNLACEGFGTGILATRANGDIICCRVSDVGTGVEVSEAQEPLFIGNLIERAAAAGVRNRNSGAGFGANYVRDCPVGFLLEGTGNAVLDANVLCRNQVGARITAGALPVVTENAVRNNTGSGFLLEDGADPLVEQNDIYQNAVDVEVRGYDPPRAQPIVFGGNYWASLDTLAIESARIVDAEEDPARGARVDVNPVSPTSFFPLNTNLGALCNGSGPEGAAAIMDMLQRLATAKGWLR